MKVADSALYTVTCASGVIFLISLLVGSPRQIMVTHPCDKTVSTWQRAQIWGIPEYPNTAQYGVYTRSCFDSYQNSFGYIPHIALAAMS